MEKHLRFQLVAEFKASMVLFLPYSNHKPDLRPLGRSSVWELEKYPSLSESARWISFARLHRNSDDDELYADMTQDCVALQVAVRFIVGLKVFRSPYDGRNTYVRCFGHGPSERGLSCVYLTMMRYSLFSRMSGTPCHPENGYRWRIIVFLLPWQCLVRICQLLCLR